MDTITNLSVKPRLKSKAAYIDRLPPCNNACPAGENIQQWLQLLLAHDIRGAFNEIMLHNPFPAIHGRACYHHCEAFCNRTHFDSAINIHACERFIGDTAIKEKWPAPTPAKASGNRVLVVGAGPAGLSAAYHLRCLGHQVVVYEADQVKGGMLHTGIPGYRLPRAVVKAEIARIENMGVSIECGHKVTDVVAEKARGKFAAVFLAIGAGRDKTTPLIQKDPLPIFGALDFLRQVEFGAAPNLGEHVAIYGGGNTAIDVARTALRLGVKKATIIYRRDRAHMPAFYEEVVDAEDEGVEFYFLRTINKIQGQDLELAVMQLDAKSMPEPSGALEKFTADSLVLALGQDVVTDFLKAVPGLRLTDIGTIEVEENLATNVPGIFAGGDVITHHRSITEAVGYGKQAARHIDAYWRGTTYHKEPKHEIASFDYLHLYAAQRTAREKQALLPVAEREHNFKEVVFGLTEEQVLAEAKRCFSCGNCFECDSCYNVCPVKAITKLGKGKRYRIDKEKCIGCRWCFKKCPCGAIYMVEN